jgi:hypothetical protein
MKNKNLADAGSFVFRIGRANDSLGLEALEIFADERLAYSRTVGDKVVLQVVGRCESQTFSRFVGYLGQTAYPAPAQTVFLPGGAQIAVGVDVDQLVYLDRGGAGKQPGYKYICEELIRLTDGFRLKDKTLFPPWLLEHNMPEPQWRVVGWKVLTSEEYPVSQHDTEAEAETAAADRVRQTWRGESKDHLYIVDKDGKRRRYPASS